MNVVNSASSIWQADVLTLFPEMFPGPLGFSLAGRALEKKIWECRTHDLRESGFGVHRNVDDAPFGGGAGMVLRADVLDGALGKIRRGMAGAPARPPVYFTPRGIPLTQEHIADFARGPGAILICGRFEGVDERFLRRRGVQEFSLGDFVLSGGEIPALAFLDGCVRLLPEVMGSPESSVEESFADGLLEYPQFTRPSVWEGEAVPEVLTSGDHGAVARWRKKQAEETTRERRPDLWAVYRKTQKTA